MRTFKESLPLVLYIAKVMVDKVGRKGIRVNASLVKMHGKWQYHSHVRPYDDPCDCILCQPNFKEIPA